MTAQLHLIPPPVGKNPPVVSSRWPLLVLVAVIAVVVILAVVAERHWPFTRSSVIQALQEQSGATVTLSGFHGTYFPNPGCVAEGIAFHRNDNQSSPPFITIRRLSVVGSYPGLLARRLQQVRAEGMHVLVAHAAGASPAGGKGISINSAIAIGKIIADGAQVEIVPEKPEEKPLLFSVQKLSLDSIAAGRPLSFHGRVRIPEPPGDVSVSGQFGPLPAQDVGQTRLWGSFTLEHGNLGVFDGIAGTVSASGKFSGVLRHVEVSGTTDVPDFEVRRNQHPVHLSTTFQAVVDGMKGDVTLDPISAHWGRTTIFAKAIIEGPPDQEGHGKIVTLTANSSRARTEDLLRLFTRDSSPPMTGNIVFRANVTLPPEKRPFLDKVRLQGDFGIGGGQYTKFTTQKNVDVLSARARGQADKVEDQQARDPNYDPGRVLSNVKGGVDLRDGVAHLSHVSFDVPGASAVVSGTYNLKSEKVDLRGPVRLDAPLSKATTGVKSLLLKVIQPLVQKKKQKGSTVEVKVAGTYRDPSFTVLPIPPK